MVNPQALIACVHKEHSAALLKQKFGHANIVTVLAKDNVQGVEQGDIIILGVEPSVYRNVLAEPGMRAALKNKTLVSIVGGVSTQKLQDAIFGQTSITEDEKRNHCHIVRVTPSTAAAVHESVSLISVEDDRHHPPPILNAVYSLFLRVGQVKLWPEELQPAGATLIAGSLAFLSVGLEGLVKSAIREGIEEDDALKMASAALLGLSKLIAAGETPEEVRKKVATRGGKYNFTIARFRNIRIKESL